MKSRDVIKSLVDHFNFEFSSNEETNVSIAYAVNILSPVVFRVSFRDYLVLNRIYSSWQAALDNFAKFNKMKNDYEKAKNRHQSNNNLLSSSSNNTPHSSSINNNNNNIIVNSNDNINNTLVQSNVNNNNNDNIIIINDPNALSTPQIQQKFIFKSNGINFIVSTYEESVELEKTLLALYFDSLGLFFLL